MTFPCSIWAHSEKHGQELFHFFLIGQNLVALGISVHGADDIGLHSLSNGQKVLNLIQFLLPKELLIYLVSSFFGVEVRLTLFRVPGKATFRHDHTQLGVMFMALTMQPKS